MAIHSFQAMNRPYLGPTPACKSFAIPSRVFKWPLAMVRCSTGRYVWAAAMWTYRECSPMSCLGLHARQGTHSILLLSYLFVEEHLLESSMLGRD